MKKNELTDKHYGKGSKGFYAALGISAVMIGSACLFAHKQGDKLQGSKLAAEKTTTAQEAAVDKRVTDIPKATSPAYKLTTTTAATTLPAVVTTHEVTIPAAEIIVDAPGDNDFTDVSAELPEGVISVGVTKMENPKPPLADISNVMNPFSGSDLVKNETTGSWQTHNGTDFASEVGAEVFATASGEITSITNDPLWGVTVVLDHHNGFMTRYCGLGSDLAVQQGDVIASGDLIGAVGETADIESSSAPHLHVEITHNGAYIDPISALTRE